MLALLHPFQQARLEALRNYSILDSPEESKFDEVVHVVGQACEAPIALISLVDADRQWFKARTGLDVRQTPLDASVCAHGILEPEFLEIADLAQDERTCDNPLVNHEPHLRFYAGAPLTNDAGMPLGMLCVLDYKPRALSSIQRTLLKAMASLVMERIELRRALMQEQATHARLQDVLDQSALTQVTSFLRLYEWRHGSDPGVARALRATYEHVAAIVLVHNHLQRVAGGDLVPADRFLASLVQEISSQRPPHVRPVKVQADAIALPSDKALVLGLAAAEMIANAIKHAFGSGDEGAIHVSFLIEGQEAVLRVSDNGIGMPGGVAPGQASGLGLRLLSKFAQQLGGVLMHHSNPGDTSFWIRVPVAAG